MPELLQDQLQALNVTPPVYVLDTPDQGQVSKDLQRLTQALRKLFFDGQSNRKIAVRQVRCLFMPSRCSRLVVTCNFLCACLGLQLNCAVWGCLVA